MSKPPKITKLLLTLTNPHPAREKRVGEWILAEGKQHLWSERANQSSTAIDTIVIHYTSAIFLEKSKPYTLDNLLYLFCSYSVSSHYLIARTGKIMQLVPEEKKAWHAGGSIMPAPDLRTNVNEFSIGIELVATPDSGFTQKQYGALVRLITDIKKRYDHTFTLTGHEDIAGSAAVEKGLRAEPKSDPGHLFDWNELRKNLGPDQLILLNKQT